MRQMEGPGSPQPYNTGYDSEENGEEKADVAFRREDTGSIKIEDEKAIETVRKEITGSSLRPRHSTDTFHLYIQTVSLQIPSLRDPSRNQYTPIDGPNSLENTGHKREHISRFRCLDERLIKIPITDLVEESDAGLFEKLYDEYYKTFAGGPNSWRRFFSFYGVEQVKIDLFRVSSLARGCVWHLDCGTEADFDRKAERSRHVWVSQMPVHGTLHPPVRYHRHLHLQSIRT